MEKSDLVYLNHIRDCITTILEYTKGMSQEDFLNDKKTIDAVIRNFEIIGEATKKLSDPLRHNYPQIEWKKIAGMRDKLIHDYIEVDHWAVWGVVEDILPGFQKQINEIISQYVS
jgi:uncharacterized protein with HEPN domain